MLGVRLKASNTRETSMTNEPLAIRAAIVAAVGAIINLIVVFGIDLSADQIAAITTATTVLTGLVIVLWTRGAVTPVANPKDAQGVPMLQVDPVEYEDYIAEVGEDEEAEEMAPEGEETQG